MIYLFIIERLESANKKRLLLEETVEKRTEQINIQKELVEKKSLALNESIRYAKIIQEAILNNESELDESELEYFNLFIPKDIVSGDFYWYKKIDNQLYIAVVDCTGHGVPGGFMSMLGIAYLNEITSNDLVISTGVILDELRGKIIKLLGQKGKDEESRDGMDMSLIRIDLKTKKMQFSGAMNSIFIARNKVFTKLSAERKTIGYSHKMSPFTSINYQMLKNDVIYLMSDGYVDQFGGEKDKKFGSKRFKELLLSVQEKSMKEQKKTLKLVFKNWMKESKAEQIDDVCVMGVKI